MPFDPQNAVRTENRGPVPKNPLRAIRKEDLAKVQSVALALGSSGA
jgi:hypothetical protein